MSDIGRVFIDIDNEIWIILEKGSALERYNFVVITANEGNIIYDNRSLSIIKGVHKLEELS